MNLIIVILTIVFACAVGLSFIRLFNFVEDNLLAIASSFGLGLGIIGFQLFWYSRVGITWKAELIILPWVIFAGLIILFNKKKNVKLIKVAKVKPAELLLLAGIFINGLYTVSQAVIRPPIAWDSWAIWLLKSKIFFIDGFVNSAALNYLSSNYPIVLSLFGTFIYIVLGQTDDSSVLLVSSAFYIFLGIAFFSALKMRFSTFYSLLFTFFLLTIQNLIRHGGRLEAGQADLPLAYFIFVSAVLFLNYLKKREFKTLVILNLFLGICSLIKFEGAVFSLIIELAVVYNILKHKEYKFLFPSLFWFLPLIDWILFVKINNIAGVELSNKSFVFSLGRIIDVIKMTILEFMNIKTWGFLWILGILSLPYILKRGSAESKIISVIIAVQFLVYLFLYLFVTIYTPESSLGRLLVHIAPLFLLVIAFSAHSAIKRYFH